MASRRMDPTTGLYVYLVLCGIFTSSVVGFESADEYFNTWNSEENVLEVDPLRIYPFSETFYDGSFSSSATDVDLEIGFNFPFMGRDFHTAKMTRTGLVGFNESFPGDHYQGLPNPLYPDEPDPPALAPFFQSFRGGRNYFYRTLELEDWPEGGVEWEVTRRMLLKLSKEIQVSVLTAPDFMASHGLICTWYQAPFISCPPTNGCPVNTLQAVLLTDKQRTYAIYNYHDMEWYGDYNCDPSKCHEGQAGFNAGYGRMFIPLPHSGTPDVVKLAEYSGAMGIQGRYIFDVTNMKIERGGCIDDFDASHLPEWPIEHYPHTIHMFGGRELQLTGFCPDPDEPITCKFGKEDAEEHPGYVIDPYRIGCIPPPVPAAGEVQVWIKIRNYQYITFVHIEPYLDKNPKVKLVDFKEKWYSKTTEELTLTWNPYDLILGGPVTNGTSPTYPPIEPHPVNIKLFAYKETKPAGQDRESMLSEVHVLESEGENDGELTFLTADHHCTEGDCDWHVGAIQVSLANAERLSVLWSRVVPLGWYVDEAMTEEYGPDWPEQKCRIWAGDDDIEELIAGLQADNWIGELPPCPCTLPQALGDPGRWIVDPDCDPPDPDNPFPCPLHPSAKMCFVPPRPSPTGSQSKCCYNQEDNLMYSQDLMDGGFSGKFYQEGLVGYNYPPIVPAMTHWYRDKLPLFWCCRWTDKPEVCHTYFSNRRPTPECRNYQEPRQGSAYGDPHFRTFDGNSFIFNGQGEFWMLRVDDEVSPANNFHLQARFEQPTDGEWGFATTPQATIMTALVMQEGVGSPQLYEDQGLPPIEVFLDPFNPVVDYSTLSVYADGELVNLGQEGITTYNVKGANDRYIRINLGGKHEKPDNVTIIFPSDVAVQVAAKEGVLHTMVLVPPELYGKTSGLFGVWNGDPEDDLRPPFNSSIPVNPEDPENVHYDYGILWNVSESDSLFLYYSMLNWDHYNANLDFRPNFKPEFPDDSGLDLPSEEEVRQFCEENDECIFDYMTTLDQEIAMDTKHQHLWAEQIAAFSQPVATCLPIFLPNSIREVTHYMVDGEVKMMGCYDGYTLRGPELYTCRPNGENGLWEPQMTTECKSNKEIDDENRKLAIAIAVPLCLLAVACIVIVLLVFVFKRRKETPKDPQPYNGVSKEPDPLSGSRTPSRHGSRSSVNSIVLSEELRMSRPPRPQRGSHPPSLDGESNREPETRPPERSYDNAAANWDSEKPRIENPPTRPAPVLNRPQLGRYTSKESLDKIFQQMGQENPAFRSRENIPAESIPLDSDTLKRSKPAPADSIPPVNGRRTPEPFPQMLHGHSNPVLADTDEVDLDYLEQYPTNDYRAPTPPYPYNPRSQFVPSSGGTNSFV